MIPDTPNDFLVSSLLEDLEALYGWAAVVGDEAYNLVNVDSELNLGNPEDFQRIVEEMDIIKDRLTALKSVVRNLKTTDKEESK